MARTRYKCGKCGDVLHSREHENSEGRVIKWMRSQGIIGCKCAIRSAYRTLAKASVLVYIIGVMTGWVICSIV